MEYYWNITRVFEGCSGEARGGVYNLGGFLKIGEQGGTERKFTEHLQKGMEFLEGSVIR